MLIATMCVSFKVLVLIVKEEIVARADGQTDGWTAELTTISPPFFQKAWGKKTLTISIHIPCYFLLA